MTGEGYQSASIQSISAASGHHQPQPLPILSRNRNRKSKQPPSEQDATSSNSSLSRDAWGYKGLGNDDGAPF
jgi:hypothetical protein